MKNVYLWIRRPECSAVCTLPEHTIYFSAKIYDIPAYDYHDCSQSTTANI